MTEEEAKTKWCPMWRIGQTHDFAAANSVNNHSAAKCIGSDCMMWRWITPVSFNQNTGKYFNPAPSRDEDGRPRGYCGLAGKP